MYREVLAMSASILEERDLIHPLALCNLLRSTGSAHYFLGTELEGDAAILEWQRALGFHVQCLDVAESNQISALILIAHTNIAIINAWLGNKSQTTVHLKKVEGLAVDTDHASPILPHWIRFCEVLLLCQSEEHERGWDELLLLASVLSTKDLLVAPVLDAALRRIVLLGKRSGKFDAALNASQMQLELHHKRRRLLAKTLGETVDDVMALPTLLKKNHELSELGQALELSIADRNLELSRALDELQAEAKIRLDAEIALQKAHGELEDQVRVRTAELEKAMGIVMRQEKQIALGRLVVSVAHEMNTPLGNANMAASTMRDHCERLLKELQGTTLSRSKLQNALHSLVEGNVLLARSLETAGNLVQRFRALAIEQHHEQLTRFDLSERCNACLEIWKNRLNSQDIQLNKNIAPFILQQGYPNALCQVLDQLIENAVKHGLNQIENGQIEVCIARVDDVIQIEVSDNGLGIASEHISRIFEPFYSKKLGQDGIGLGLSIVNSLVTDLMHGKINVDNSSQGGAIVKLQLPLQIAAKT
jgi:signal transduction histidine kinase